MAKISQYPTAANIQDADLFIVARESTAENFSLSVQSLRDKIFANTQSGTRSYILGLDSSGRIIKFLETSLKDNLYQNTILTDAATVSWDTQGKVVSTALLDTVRTALTLSISNINEGTHHCLFVRKQSSSDLEITCSNQVYKTGGTSSASTITLSGQSNQLFKLEFNKVLGSVSIAVNVEMQGAGSGISDGDKGDITITGGVWTIDNNAVTNAKILSVAWSKITGVPNLVYTDQTYTDPSWILSLDYGKITNPPAAGHVIAKQLTPFTQRETLSFSNLFTVTDDAVNDATLVNINTAGLPYEPVISAGTVSQYWRGDKSWQTFNLQNLTAVGNTTNQGIVLTNTTGSKNVTISVDTNGNIIFNAGLDQNFHFSGDVVAFSSMTPPASSWWELMPIATASTLGGVKIGSGLSINGSGVLSVTGGSGGVGTVTGTGIANYIAYWNSETAITGESTLTYDPSLNILSLQSIDFSLAHAATSAERRVFWDNDEGTLSTVLKGGNVSIGIGSSVTQLVHNAESTTLTKGTVVYAFGASGQRISVKRAVNTSDATSAQTVGVIAESIAAGSEGWMVVSGTVRGLDTSAYLQGDALYLGATAGAYSSTKPYAPNHLVYVGFIVKVHASSGEIFVRCQNGYEMAEIHDYQESGVADKNVISYESSSGLYKPKSIATLLGFTPEPAISSGTASQYWRGDKSWQTFNLQNLTAVGNTTNQGIVLTNTSGSKSVTVSVDANGNIIFNAGVDQNFHFSGDVVAFSSMTPPVGSWWTSMPYATTTTVGGVKVDGTTITINGSGVISAVGGGGTSLNGTGFVRMSGTTVSYVTGTSSQFVKADGSVDSTSYITSSGSITGSSGSLSLGSGAINTSAWAGTSGYHGYTYTGGNYRFGFSSTSGVVDVYADGNFYATDSSYLVLNAGNYTSYSPSLTGTGASGTWGISITGSAGSVAWGNVTGKPNEIFNYDGWVASPGYDANSIAGNKSGFTYSNNAPWTGPLAHFAAGGYGLQFNATYSGGGNNISFRTRNGDTPAWNGWKEFIHSGNIGSQSVSYATSSGSSSQVTINYNNDSNSTYQMLWGSGNSVYGTGGVYLNPSNDYVYAASFNASDWFRSTGDSGWYSTTYGGGIFMQDTTWVRTYNSKNFYSGSEIRAESQFSLGGGWSWWDKYGTYSSSLHQVAYISFDWDADYDTYASHGIASTDSAGLFTDDISINSYSDINFRLDSNSNDTAEYVRFHNNSTGSNQFAYMGYNGSVYLTSLSGTLYNSGDVIAFYSDERLKKDVRVIDFAIDKLKKIGGYYYRPNEKALELSADSEDKQRLGVLAQEIAEVFPEVIEHAPFDRNEDGSSKTGENYMTVKYERLVPVLIQAIKEQQKKIEELESKIN